MNFALAMVLQQSREELIKLQPAAILSIYAEEYLKHWPRSNTHRIDELVPLEARVSKFLEYEDWHCDKWPGRNTVTFFSWVEPCGVTASWSVSFLQDSATITQL